MVMGGQGPKLLSGSRRSPQDGKRRTRRFRVSIRSYKSGLLGLTAAAALMAAPAFSQTQPQAQPRDGTPGNPPSTATQRAADAVTGNRTAPDGTPGNPPGTAVGRAAENTPAANQRGDFTSADRPDGTQGNPPGTVVSRGVDRAMGTNTSGAFPENEQGGNQRSQNQGSAGSERGTVTGRGPAAQGGARDNEPAAANANPRAMGQQAQGGQPGAVNTTPDGGQARVGTANVPLQNQAAGTAPNNPNGPSGARDAGRDNAANNTAPGNNAAGGTAAGGAASTANAPIAQTDRASRIIGSTVYNERNESIGSVDDIILASGNSSPMAVVSVGGFLGIGAKLVAVPMSDLRWSAADNRWTITGATKESLTALPSFSYDAARRG
jgi:hypothetical protein